MTWFSSNKKEAAWQWEHLSASTDWNALTATDEWIIVFKHSNRCGTSAMALKQFEKQWAAPKDVRLCMIDVVKERTFSQEIARLTGVEHQSPQLILLKNRTVAYNASHYQIDAADVINIIKELP